MGSLHLGVILDDLGDEFLERDGLERNIATTKTGISQDVVNQSFHARAAPNDALEVIASFVVETLAIIFNEGLGIAFHDANRSAEVMGNTIRELFHLGDG